MPATGFQSKRISSGASDAARSPRSEPAESVVAFPARSQRGIPAVPAEPGNFFPRGPAQGTTRSFASDCPQRVPGILAAVLLHAALLPVLLRERPVPPEFTPPIPPVMVELITEARPEAEPVTPPIPKPVEPVKPKTRTPKPKPPPKPKPVPPKIRRPPVLSAPVDAPAPAASTDRQVPAPPPPVEAAPAPPRAAAPAPVSPPRFNANYLHNPAPAYPALSRSLGEEGRVVLRVLVDAEGRAERVEIRTSSGHGRLDQTARETVQRWKFVPARRGDQPVAAWVLVPISFSLED